MFILLCLFVKFKNYWLQHRTYSEMVVAMLKVGNRAYIAM